MRFPSNIERNLRSWIGRHPPPRRRRACDRAVKWRDYDVSEPISRRRHGLAAPKSCAERRRIMGVAAVLRVAAGDAELVEAQRPSSAEIRLPGGKL